MVDDSDPNRVVIKRYLNILGRSVDEAINGQDAINKIKIIKSQPNLDINKSVYIESNDTKQTSDQINLNIEEITSEYELNNYDIIWMDIQMPRMNGIKCTEYLRKVLKYKGTIIGLTGHVDAGTINDCEKAGMNAILPKPIEKNVLHAYIDKYKYNFIA